MSIRISKAFHCDFCHRWFWPKDVSTNRKMQGEALQLGWKIQDGLAKCPVCLHKMFPSEARSKGAIA